MSKEKKVIFPDIKKKTEKEKEKKEKGKKTRKKDFLPRFKITEEEIWDPWNQKAAEGMVILGK